MSKKVRRGRNTTIDYEFSEWDADMPRSHRERSNSVDLLQELRRSKKVHAPSQTNMARFSEHYETHVVTVPNQAPNPTFARSFRYGKEPDKPHCHEWKRRPDALTVARGVQCDIKPPQRTTLVQCSPATREMNIQTHRGHQDSLVVVRAQSKDRGSQTGQVADTSYEELLTLIRGLKKAPQHNPDGFSQQIAASLAELMALLRTVHQTANHVEAKEEEILSAVRNVSLTGAPTTGEFSQDALLRVAGLLDQIHILIKASATQEDASRLTALILELNTIISGLKADSNQMLVSIRALAEQKSGDVEGYFLRITTYLKEILELLQVEEEEEVISRRQLYDGKCRCADIADATNAVSKGINNAMLPSLCQRCINDFKGRTFVQSLNLPMALSAEVVNTLGKAIECIERDDEFNMKLLLGECKKIVGNKWENRTYQVTYEALFHLSLLWRSQKTCNLLGGMIEVGMMVRAMKNEEHRFRLPDYIQKAISLKNVEILETLFENITEQEKVMIINTPLVKNGARKFPLFAAARVGDCEIFQFLVNNGASLDVRETDRTILHEIAWISSKKPDSPKLKEWNKVLVSMLGVIYNRSGVWWERQLLHAAWSGCTEASRLNALKYLFSIPDSSGLNALQFAARHATPEIIRKIVCNVPYEFIPDPLEFGHDNGLRGYVVDQIESRLAENNSVLERMLLRDPLDGAGVMTIEPFKSMIEDKWKRFRIFYGIWFICYLCYMFVYTWCAIERPLDKGSIAEMYQTSNDYARLIGEIIVLFFLPLFLYGEIRDGVRMGFIAPRPWLRTGIFRILNVIFVILTIIAVILRLTLNPNEDKPLGLALLLGWLLALEFLGAWQCIGMFAIIMHKVVASDVALRFFLVWLISLTGTSAATFVAYQQSQSQILQDFPISNESFWFTPLSLTKISLAVLQADYITDATDPPFGVVLFVIFAFLFNFVLFSLAIAMMADTYSRTRAKIITSWIWVKANFALLMDRRLPNFMSISYVENEQRGGFSSIAPTKLRYLTRVSKRRAKDGRIVEAREHVVLVAKEDLPKAITVSGRDLEILSSGLLKSPRE